MASQFSVLYTDVARSIGRYDSDGTIDTDGLAISKRGVNFGMLLAALLFDPTELKTIGNLTIGASTGSVVTTTLTLLRLINSIYNTTGSRTVHPIPEEKFNLILPTGLTYVEYYYRHGTTIYTNSPVASNTLSVKYTKYPAELVNAEDVLEFSQHDSVIVAAATSYAFATLEETDSQAVWDKVLATFATPYSLNAKQLHEFKEAMKSSGYSV
jgi:hypothetical protein